MTVFRTSPRGDALLGGRITRGVRGLIIANAAVFGLQLLARLGTAGGIEPIFGLQPEMVIHEYRLWQLVTYMFLHAPTWPWHLILNMLMLWMFGTEVERAWGTTAFLRYYFV